MQAVVALGWAVTSKGNESTSVFKMIASWAFNGSKYVLSSKARDE